MSKVTAFIKKRRKLLIAACVILAIVLVVKFAFIDPAKKALEELAAQQAIPATMVLERMELEQLVTATGMVMPNDSRQIAAAATAGKAVSVTAEEGQHVAKGTVLCQFDIAQIEINIRSTQKTLSTAQAQSSAAIKQAERRVADAEAQYTLDEQRLNGDVNKARDAVDSAKKNAEKTAKAAGTQAVQTTMETLVAADTLAMQAKAVMDAAEKAWRLDPTGTNTGTGVSLLDEYLAAQTAYNTEYNAACERAKTAAQGAYKPAYDAAYNAAKPTITAAEDGHDKMVQARDTTLRADEMALVGARDGLTNAKLADTTPALKAQLETYQQQLKDATITAPISGTLTKVNIQEGETPSMGTPVFVIEDLATLKIEALVPEYDEVLLQTGLEVHITSDAEVDSEWSGVLTEISDVATDSSGNFTITTEVTSQHGVMKSGMTAKLSIVCDSRSNVFAVPYEAILTNDAGEKVIRVLDGEATPPAPQSGVDGQPPKTPYREIVVKTGLETDYYVEVSSMELEPGLEVMTDPEGKNVKTPLVMPGFGPGGGGA